jgi:putative peptidoglycan lipid II flippase
LFEHGAFGPEGTARVSAALGMLALALLPAGAVSLVTRAFYALDDFRTPVIVSAVLLVANIGLNVAFVVGVGMDVEGLALATAITSWINLLVLLPTLRRRLRSAVAGLDPTRGLGSLVPMLFASLAAGGLARAAAAVASPAGELLSLAAAGLAGAGSYFALAALLKIPEWTQLRTRFGSR